MSWFAGSGREGNADGVAIEASFNCPNWLALDQKTGTLFVSDFDSHMIRKVTHQGEFISFIFSVATITYTND